MACPALKDTHPIQTPRSQLREEVGEAPNSKVLSQRQQESQDLLQL